MAIAIGLTMWAPSECELSYGLEQEDRLKTGSTFAAAKIEAYSFASQRSTEFAA